MKVGKLAKEKLVQGEEGREQGMKVGKAGKVSAGREELVEGGGD